MDHRKKKGLSKEERSLDNWKREEAMRQCEVAFLTDKMRRPAEYWWEQYCSERLGLQAFLLRVRAAKWTAKRDSYWKEVTQEILRQSKRRIVHDQVQELDQIQKLRMDTLEAIAPRVINGRKIYPVAPSTMEGMIGALVKLDQLADNKRDAVLATIEPELEREPAEGRGTLFSTEEMREVARMLLKQRHEAHQGRLLGERNVNDEEDKEESG